MIEKSGGVHFRFFFCEVTKIVFILFYQILKMLDGYLF